MGRGIGLGCEQCDFSATLYERQPFALDAAGQPVALSVDTAGALAGYWTDGLCGECRLPVRAVHYGSVPAPNGAALICPRCGAPALTFEQAMRELAEASHSRAWRDIHREQAAAEELENALSSIPELRDAVTTGELTTPEALERIIGGMNAPDHIASALEGIGAQVENALDLDAAAHVLRARLEECESHIGALQLVADDEEFLPGVPCPQCHTGHLIHWPVWE